MINKIKSLSSTLSGGLLYFIFSSKVFAESLTIPEVVCSSDMQELYGPSPDITEPEWWLSILSRAVVPITISIVLIIGINIFIKRRRRKNAQENSQDRQA